MTTKFITAVALTLAVFGSSVSFAEAGQRHSGGGGSGTVGHAVPRGSPSAGHPIYPGGGYHPPYYGGYYRPYYGYYGYYGYPYGYYPYGFGFSIGFGFGYGYGYPYGYYGYPGYAATTYGGLKIEGMPPDASVYADGYYVGNRSKPGSTEVHSGMVSSESFPL